MRNWVDKFRVEKWPLIDVRYRICVMVVMMGERLPLEMLEVLAQARQASKSRRARIVRLLPFLHCPVRHTNTISHFLASDIRQPACPLSDEPNAVFGTL